MKSKLFLCVFTALSFIILNSICKFSSCAEKLEPIQLSQPQFDRGKPLMQALKERQSNRLFNTKKLPLDVLSNLLWAADGINRTEAGKRTAPSAVNWQEIDIYVAMEKGLYLYNSGKHTLDPVLAQDIRGSAGIQDFTKTAPVNLIYVADFSKMSGNESDNIFYSAVDTGFISQNVYLFCASEGLSTVVLGMIDKPVLAKIMRLKDNQKIILIQPVGYKK